MANPGNAQPGLDRTSGDELGQFGNQESMSTSAPRMLIEIARMMGIPASGVCAILEFETRRRQIAGLSWDWDCSGRITVNPGITGRPTAAADDVSLTPEGCGCARRRVLTQIWVLLSGAGGSPRGVEANAAGGCRLFVAAAIARWGSRGMLTTK